MMGGSLPAALPLMLLLAGGGRAIAREYPRLLAAQPASRLLARYFLASALVTMIVFSVGYLGLLGWYLDIAVLRSLSPDWPTLMPNAALGLMMGAAALWLLRPHSPSNWARWTGRCMASAVVFLGVATLAEYLGGWNFGLDTLLFEEKLRTVPLAYPRGDPGRMALATALNFLLLGLALLSMSAVSWPIRHRVMQALVIWPLGISLLAFMGYLYGVSSLYDIAAFSLMPLHAAVGCVALAAGMVLARVDRGWMRVFQETQLGSIVLRRVVPFAVVVPVLLGWLRLAGERAGLYGTEFGVGLLVIAGTASSLGLAWWLAVELNTIDRGRLQAKNELRRLNDELEQRIAERTRQLENMNKELEAFSYSVAHDLRTPLRAIDGWAQALHEDHGEALGESGRAMLDRQRAASQRLGLLIDDLLNLAHLSRKPVLLKSVDPTLLIKKIWHNFAASAYGEKATLVIGDLPRCMSDAVLLEQMLTNLLDNACKFSAGRPDPRIEIGCRRELPGEGIFFVRDNGVGFDMRYTGKLFTAFHRLHGAHEFPGTGIGLAIVQRVIHRHGGRVWAEAEVGGGATFYFTLPLA